MLHANSPSNQGDHGIGAITTWRDQTRKCMDVEGTPASGNETSLTYLVTSVSSCLLVGGFSVSSILRRYPPFAAFLS